MPKGKKEVWVLTCRNWFGMLGLNSSTHSTRQSAEDEALGRGRWQGQKPLRAYAITGPYAKVPPLNIVSGEKAVQDLPAGPGF